VDQHHTTCVSELIENDNTRAFSMAAVPQVLIASITLTMLV